MHACMHAGKTADDIYMTLPNTFEKTENYMKTARQLVKYSGINWSSVIASDLWCKMKKRAV